MVTPTIKMDLRSLDAGIKDAVKNGRNLSPVFRDLLPLMKADQKVHFRSSESPDGSWRARAQSTVKSHGKRPILGKLRSAFTVEFGPKFIRALSKVKWSGVHQEGGTAGYGARIPQRTHLWLSDDFVDLAIDRMNAMIWRAWNPRRSSK
jgi:phage gpG-like protein